MKLYIQIWPNYCNISARFGQITAISQPDWTKLLQYLSQIWQHYCNISARFDQINAISQADLANLLQYLSQIWPSSSQRLPDWMEMCRGFLIKHLPKNALGDDLHPLYPKSCTRTGVLCILNPSKEQEDVILL